MRKDWIIKTDAELDRIAKGKVAIRGLTTQQAIDLAKQEIALRKKDQKKGGDK